MVMPPSVAPGTAPLTAPWAVLGPLAQALADGDALDRGAALLVEQAAALFACTYAALWLGGGRAGRGRSGPGGERQRWRRAPGGRQLPRAARGGARPGNRPAAL